MKIYKKGFTLIELLVSISIVAILSVIGITTYSGIQSRARDTQRSDDARKIITALEQYHSSAGKYPLAAGTGASGWGASSDSSAWITGLDTANFINNKLPADPKTGQKYYYLSSDGTDYCLQVIQENDVTGHPYLSNKTDSNNILGKWLGVWHLRFGPKGATTGDCNSPGTSV